MPIHQQSACALLLSVLMVIPATSQAAEPLLAGTPEIYTRCGGFLESPVFAPDNTLWLLDVPGDRILSVDSAGNCIERGKTGGFPNGARFHPDGRLFIAGSQGIFSFDTASGAMTPVVASFAGVALTAGNDLVFDADAGLYFTIPGDSDYLHPDGRVFYLAPGAQVPTVLSDRIAFPNGIAVTADGSAVLVAEFAGKRIVSLPGAKAARPTSLVFANTRGGVGPDGITLDNQGRLFVANLGAGVISVFASDSSAIGSITLPPDAGTMTSNVVVHNNFLYITEASKGEVWRVALHN